MSINLLDIIQNQVTGQLANQASSFLGESESATKSGLQAIFPSLLGSVINKSTEPNGAAGIMDMIKGLDNNMLGNIGSLFGGGASNVNGLLNSGGGILNMLLGNKMGGVVDLIAKVSGLKSGSSSSLLKMAAPFLLSMIGKQVAGKGLSGLTDLLMGQRNHVQKSLPAGMGNLMGFANLGDDLRNTGKKVEAKATHTRDKVADTTRRTTSTVNHNNNSGGGMGWLKWLLPLVLLAALAYFLMGDGCAKAENAVDKTADVVKEGVEKTGELAKDAGNAVVGAAEWTVDGIKNVFGEVNEAAKAALGKITFAAGSAGRQMIDFIEGGFEGDPVFRFHDLTFATGSANINGETGVEVDNVAAILKAYPNVKVRVEGYTDNTGDAAANMKLSQARAEAVKGRLIAQGINGSRIEAKGYGQNNPVASNNTEEGKAENRRTEIRIIK